jgi:hypothetical protein
LNDPIWNFILIFQYFKVLKFLTPVPADADDNLKKGKKLLAIPQGWLLGQLAQMGRSQGTFGDVQAIKV